MAPPFPSLISSTNTLAAASRHPCCSLISNQSRASEPELHHVDVERSKEEDTEEPLPGAALRRRCIDDHVEPEQTRGGVECGGATAGSCAAADTTPMIHPSCCPPRLQLVRQKAGADRNRESTPRRPRLHRRPTSLRVRERRRQEETWRPVPRDRRFVPQAEAWSTYREHEN